VLINEPTQLDPTQVLWMFDNGGEILSMKKPELVIIAKSRLGDPLAQQFEGMDEVALRKQLTSLVCIYFVFIPCRC
jgi:hypothetical protein